MIARLRSRYGRLRWKLTGSYTIVAALTFFIIQAILFVLVLTLLGINPFRSDIGFISNLFAPSLMNDIEIMTRQELAQTSPDTRIMEYNIEQKWTDFIPQTAVSAPLFSSDHVMTVVILDNNKEPVLVLPEFEQELTEQSVFNASAFANDAYGGMITAVFANRTPPQPYAHLM